MKKISLRWLFAVIGLVLTLTFTVNAFAAPAVRVYNWNNTIQTGQQKEMILHGFGLSGVTTFGTAEPNCLDGSVKQSTGTQVVVSMRANYGCPEEKTYKFYLGFSDGRTVWFDNPKVIVVSDVVQSAVSSGKTIFVEKSEVSRRVNSAVAPMQRQVRQQRTEISSLSQRYQQFEQRSAAFADNASRRIEEYNQRLTNLERAETDTRNTVNQHTAEINQIKAVLQANAEYTILNTRDKKRRCEQIDAYLQLGVSIPNAGSYGCKNLHYPGGRQ